MAKARPHYSTAPTGRRLQSLLEGGYALTAKEAASMLKSTYSTINEYIRQMRTDGLLYVERWEPSPRGLAVPVWAWGDDADAPRPAAKGATEISKRYWAKMHVDLGSKITGLIHNARRSRKSMVVVQGVVVWRRGQPIDRAAVRAALKLEPETEEEEIA